MRDKVEAATLLAENALENLRCVKILVEENNRARPETYYGYAASDDIHEAVGHVENVVEHLRSLLGEFGEEKQ